MKNKYIYIFGTFFFCLFLYSFNIKNNSESEGYVEDLREIKTDIRSAYTSIATYQSDEIFVVLKYNIQRFKEFSQNVNNVTNLSAALQYIVIEFRQLAISYTAISNLSDVIGQNAQDNLDVVSSSITRCQTIIDELEAEIILLSARLIEIEELLGTNISSSERERLLAEKNSKISIRNSTESQKTTFQNAKIKIEELNAKLIAFVQNLDLLLYTLDLNADVYVAAADALEVALIYQTLVDGLVDLGDLVPTTTEIIQSWGALNDIVDEIDALSLGGGK